MFAKLSLLSTMALLAASMVSASPAKLETRALKDPFADTLISHRTKWMRINDKSINLDRACKDWNKYSEDQFQRKPQSINVSDCKVVSEKDRIIAAYTTQLRQKDLTNWSQTGAVGSHFKYEFLLGTDCECKQIAPGFCKDPIILYWEERIQ